MKFFTQHNPARLFTSTSYCKMLSGNLIIFLQIIIIALILTCSSVRRDHLVTDSLKEISSKQKDLKKKLKVSFVGEPGLDMGGLTKEWSVFHSSYLALVKLWCGRFQLLIKQIFAPEYGMFVYHAHSHCYWFSMIQEGNLRSEDRNNCQTVNRPSPIALSVTALQGVQPDRRADGAGCVQLHHTGPSLPWHLLPQAPHPACRATGQCRAGQSNDPDHFTVQEAGDQVGVARNIALEDLAEIMPEVATSLQNILEYEGDVEADMFMTFQISVGEYGKIKTVDLKPGGEDIPVTGENR